MLQHQYETPDILMLLDLEDEDICVTDVSEENHQKLITLETRPTPHYCPACGFRMYSRGVKKRVVNHPILQDTYHLLLILKQRRWRCSNPKCQYEVAEAFRFVNKNRRTTNATDMLIILEYQKLSMTTAAIAEKFHRKNATV